MITVDEIDKELGYLKGLEESWHNGFNNPLLRLDLLDKMVGRYLSLIDECLEWDLTEFQVEDLLDLKVLIKDCLDGDGKVCCDMEFDLNAVLSSGFIIFDVIFST